MEDSEYNEVRSAFDLQCKHTLVKLIFKDNSALFGRSQIFGGWLGWSVDENGITGYNFDAMKGILSFYGDDSQNEIASDPIRICLCKGGKPDCNTTHYPLVVYGHAVRLDLVAVGQQYSTVPSYVKLNLTSGRGKRIQSLQANCTSITYTIDPDPLNVKQLIIMLKPCFDCHGQREPQNFPKNGDNTSMTAQALLLFQPLSIQLNFRDCPLGFTLHKSNGSCVCESSLVSAYGIKCDMNNYTIYRGQQWVGVTIKHTTAGESSGVIVHQRCPFDYCRTGSLSISLEDPDEQCAFNRAGILCGGYE